jgi:hypothetical protein
MLMSLRAQLQAPQGSTRPVIAAQLNTDNLHDTSRCNVVLWAPRSSDSQFLAGHASGNILVYKKVRARVRCVRAVCVLHVCVRVCGHACVVCGVGGGGQRCCACVRPVTARWGVV